ncbi:hypothetical protein [Bradyrhizobium sp. CB2312]|uniref:hypothetical protein n=1 Tax=Bradyrhizobium sp. CB2312 TaxID=3039155 RepID=UPI0024B1B540|nr:hypothetical protein [Bradyrhizobium sp. CB2312]WFU76584.1 hypothetical protein QA642_22550 [Bradyrhizobium sp. CB2312]
MNQRFDLFAFSLLLFAVILTVWLIVLPVSLDGIARWQTLISGAATFLGIIVASWNVTRQMRLAARGREQDRIERELPGLREAAYFLGRFEMAFGNDAKASPVRDEFKALQLDEAQISDFLAQVIKALPMTPDVIKRRLALELFQLRGAAQRVVENEDRLKRAKGALDRAERTTGLSVSEAKTALERTELVLQAAIERFEKAVREVKNFRIEVTTRIKGERARGEALRRELERSLALRE